MRSRGRHHEPEELPADDRTKGRQDAQGRHAHADPCCPLLPFATALTFDPAAGAA